MLARLIAASVRHPSAVIVAAGIMLLFAGLRIRDMPVDVFPELNAPTVVIMTEAPGLAADEVETNVTFPIESAINGLPGTRRVRSASATSLSMVWAEFDWDMDLYRARQLVAERLAAVRAELPENVHAEIMPITSITGEIMLFALSSPGGETSPLELRSFAEFELRHKLLAVPGVAQVVSIGGELPEYEVAVRQDRLDQFGLSIGDVVRAARGAHSTASAGYLPSVEHQEMPLRQMARVRSTDDLASTLVERRGGLPIRIGDVADVRLGPAPKRGTGSDDGMPAVVVSVKKSPGTNTFDLTQRIDAVLDQMETAMPPGVVLNREPFRAARFIERSVRNIVKVLVEASVVVAVIIILFLMNVRATLITLTALPLSLAAALLILWALGLSLNVMTMGGLAVAIGELVDDAIIDVENVLRRLRQEWAKPAPERRPAVRVILDASNEIRSAMVFATIIICIVFVPLLFLQGVEGRFFQPLGIAYIVSIMASLLVALTVTPALCRLVFGSHGTVRAAASPDGHGGDGALARWLKRTYQPMLEWCLAHRGRVLAASGAFAALAVALATTFGSSFLPSFQEGTFNVFLMCPPGTSLAESDRLARGVELQFAQIDGVRSVTRRTGRAERDEHAEPVSNSEIEVAVEEGADQAAVRAQIDRIVANIPSVTTMVGQPIEHRLSHVLSGTPAAIAINVFGEDLDGLRTVAKEIEAALKATPGTRDVAANREIMVTSLPIRYRHDALAAAGLTPAAAAEQVQEALHGVRVAQVAQGVRRYDIVVRLASDERERIDQVMDLRLRGEGGSLVRLREVADIGPERTSNLISRENAQRKAIISTNVADGYDLGSLAREVQERVDPIVRAAGFTVEYGGQFEAQQSASRSIWIMGLGVAVVMFLLLQSSMGGSRQAILVMLNLPLALIGGIATVYVTESPSVLNNTLALFGIGGRFVPPVISIASMVGFVTLFGIAVRNGILLVNHFRYLEQHEGCTVREAVVRGAVERLIPILMTALTAALGLLPLALARGQPGSELLAPLAAVVLGGLLSSTALNLVVIPAGYSLLLGSGPRPVRNQEENDPCPSQPSSSHPPLPVS
jgi:CzcA family heavy metal efflux pump